jgi:alpha-1,2-mannosyltransferase
VIAGVFIGLVAFKPQLGPLLVLVLVMHKQWRAMFAAISTTVAVAGFSVYLWGLAPWHYYLTNTLSAQASFLHTAEGYWAAQMTTPFAITRYLGMPYPVSMAFQILVSISVLFASLAVLRRKECPWSLQVAVITFGSTLLTPYLLVYDLAMPVAALLWYISDQDAEFSEKEFLILALLWLLPFAAGITLQGAGLPVIAVTMIACFALLVHKALRRDEMNMVVVK